MQSPECAISSLDSFEEEPAEDASLLAPTEPSPGRKALGTCLVPARPYHKSAQAQFASRFFSEEPDTDKLCRLEGQASLFQSGNSLRLALHSRGIKPSSAPHLASIQTLAPKRRQSQGERYGKPEPRRAQERRKLRLEVQALDERVLPASSSSNLARVKRMQRSRQERHDKAIEAYKAEVVLISDGIEQEVIRTGQSVQEELYGVDEDLRKKLHALHDETRLVANDYAYLEEYRNELERLCGERKEVIGGFEEKLKGLEKDRSARTGHALTELISTLTSISYLLKGEVERIVEAEALEINAVIIANLRSITDLISRMETGQFKVVKDALTSWSKAEAIWRSLRHARAVKEWHALISSEAFQEPPERSDLIVDFHNHQTELHADHRSKVLLNIASLVPPCRNDETSDISLDRLTHGAIDGSRADLLKLSDQEDELLGSFMSKLNKQRDDTLEAAMASREQLRRDIHGFSALAEEDVFTEGKRGEGKKVVDDLAGHVKDPSLEDFFQRSGGLLSLLKGVVSDAKSPKLIYADFLSSLLQRVFLMVEAFKIKEQLDLQGKSNEKTALEETLEKLRVARTADIHPLVPKLQRHVQALIAANLGDVVSMELQACHQLLDNVVPPSEDGNSAELAFHQPPLNLPDLRVAQKRLGVVVHASNLPMEVKKIIVDLYQVVLSQQRANTAVDEVIHAECDAKISKTAEASAVFLKLLEGMKRKQNVAIRRSGEKICDFYAKVAEEQKRMAVEECSVDQKYEDELDDELDRFDTLHERMETTFEETLEGIRRAENEEVLRKLEAGVKTQLHAIEQSYRRYAETCITSCGSHFEHIQKDSEAVIRRFGTIFFLQMVDIHQFTSLAEHTSDESANDDLRFLGFSFKALAEPSDIARAIISDIPIVLSSEEQHSPSQEEATTAEYLCEDEDEEEEEEPEEEEEGEASMRMEAEAMTMEDDLSHSVEGAIRKEAAAVRLKIESATPPLCVDEEEVSRMVLALRDTCTCIVLHRLRSRLTAGRSTRDTRMSEYNAELEERLRLHWPRLGRSDVQFVQPRMGQLIAHKKKHDRHLRSLMMKFKVQEDKFQRLLKGVEQEVSVFKKKMRAYAMHLSSQNSAAAINGLGKRGRIAAVGFEQQVDETFDRLLGFVSKENELTDLNEQFLDSCIAFENGGNYNEREIEQAKADLAKVDDAIGHKVLHRAALLKEWLLKAKAVKDKLTAKLNEDLQTHLHAISVRDGLGQKYGAPRRRAQQHMRELLNKSKTAAGFIDSLLEQLMRSSTSSEIPVLIDTLRKCLYLRAEYLSFLLPERDAASCLELVEHQPAEEGAMVFLSQDAARQNLEILATSSFKDASSSIEESCKEETRELYAREGLNESIIGGEQGLPEALLAFLCSLQDRADTHRMDACRQLRGQIQRFIEALPSATSRALEDLCERSLAAGRAKVAQRGDVFLKEFNASQTLRRKHKDFLRPQMANPNYTDKLSALKDEEQTRASTCREAIVACKKDTVELLADNAGVFQMEVVRCTALLTRLVDDLITEEDTLPLPGDAVVEKKRLNLKKLIRAYETTEHRKGKHASTPEGGELTSQGPPTKTWHPLPMESLNSITTRFAARVEDGESGASPEDVDEKEGKEEKSESSGEPETLVTKFTPLQAGIIAERDNQFDKFVQDYGNILEEYTATYEKLCSDEDRWEERWLKEINFLQQQARAGES